jgi:exonuclease SbcC
MKLRSISITDFRGFTGSHRFDLDAEAVVLVAANGQGKTSFFDAILWGLTGLLPRLGDSPRVSSLYSESGETRVEIQLGSQDDKTLTIVRREPGGLSVECGDERREGQSATTLIHATLWPEAEQAADGPKAFAGALTRSVYLQQDLVRDFVEGDDDKGRFTAVSELAGAGRVTELSVELESARLSWSRATNTKKKELEEASQRLEVHEAQLDSLGSVDAASAEQIAERWEAWWPVAARLEPALGERALPTPSGSEAANAIESALGQLEAARRSAERRLASAEALLEEMKTRSKAEPAADLGAQRKEAEQAEVALKGAREALAAAERSAAERRREQVERREAAEELGALAELALRHIEATCPVCGQEHDHVHTAEHLQQLIQRAGSSAPVQDTESETSTLAAELQRRESDLVAAQAALRAAEVSERESLAWAAERDQRLTTLGLSTAKNSDSASELSSLIARSTDTREAIDACEAEGERLSLDLVGASEHARAQELASTIAAEQLEVGRLSELLESRQRTGELASSILEALREASASVVDAELKRIDPLLQRIYSTADPHPCFRVVKLLSKVSHGRGRLSASLNDQLATLSVGQPEAVLSSSQLNALAVSVFLALNLGLPSVPLPVAMLDDPLQSLDDVNLLGLVDLLRRVKGERQLLLSTHDPRFGALLARKLRPVAGDGPTRVIEIEGWGRRGPTIRESEAPRDSEPLRIAVEPTLA